MATQTSQGWRAWLDTTQTVMVIAAAAVLIYFGLSNTQASRNAPAAPALPSAPVSLQGAATIGNSAAKVVMIIYSDFECPFCGKFARETWPAFVARYVESGKVLVAFRHRPLEKIHESALRGGAAAECAGRLGQKFWPMSDFMFADQKSNLHEDALVAHAVALGIDETAFKACLSGPALLHVRNEGEASSQLAITGTPTFLIGTRSPDNSVRVTQRIGGAQPLEAFVTELDKALKSAG